MNKLYLFKNHSKDVRVPPYRAGNAEHCDACQLLYQVVPTEDECSIQHPRSLRHDLFHDKQTEGILSADKCSDPTAMKCTRSKRRELTCREAVTSKHVFTALNNVLI